MIKNIFLLLTLIFSASLYSQSIEGKWQCIDNPDRGLEFKNGEFSMFDLSGTHSNFLDNLTIRYSVKDANENQIIVFEFFSKGVKEDDDQANYRIEDDILYLGRAHSEIKEKTNAALMSVEEIYRRIE